jgi:hypothetical protein
MSKVLGTAAVGYIIASLVENFYDQLSYDRLYRALFLHQTRQVFPLMDNGICFNEFWFYV